MNVRVGIAAVALIVGCASPPAPPPGASSRPAAARSAGPGSVAPVSATDGTRRAAEPPDRCARTAHPFRQPIAVVEDLDLPRYPPILSFPIAFPRGAELRSLDGFFAETLNHEVLATQTEVLSRWGDGPGACEAPIRWGYVHALAEVPPKRRAFLSLVHQTNPAPEVPVTLTVTEDEAKVVIQTGAARFTIRRDWFNGLSKVELPREGGFVTVAEVPSTADSGMLVLHRAQLASTLHGKVTSFEVERRGPVVATVAVKGTYAFRGQDAHYRYTLRMHFYAGTAAVQLDHTYYNGELTGISSESAKNLAVSDRVFFRLPLRLGDGVVVTARAKEKMFGVSPTALVSVQQDKRTPDRPKPVYAVKHGNETLEVGAFADLPLLAASGRDAYAMATIGLMGPRDPQALRYDPKTGALELDWQAEAMSIGGGRGIWSKAVLDFGPAASVDLARRGAQLHAHAARPLIGAANPAYLNTTHAYGWLPEGKFSGRLAKVDDDMDRLHAQTADYLRRYRVTGLQIWPDLSRAACSTDGTCDALEKGYFEGGDCNYWDWSLAELEQFVRSADPAFVHDFALGEAITMAETVSFRPDPGSKSAENSFAGFSPCYGSGRGWGGPWVEGLNHRTGNCPGDYSYNKVHRLAYLLTADRRFTDFFEEGARTAIRQYGRRPPDRPPEWAELSASRQTAQYMEPLLDAAELGRIGGDARNRELRDVALHWFEVMRTRALERGHTCSLLGSAFTDPKLKGDCFSIQQWMMPALVEWIERLYFLYDHAPARQWLLDFVKQSTRRSTVLDSAGHPDISALRASSDDDAQNGWRTLYVCKAGPGGIQDDTCRKITDYENGAYHYPNGLVAYLNALAMVAEVDEGGTLGLCAWLPGAYEVALGPLDASQMNDFVWGKSPAQAYAFSQRALATIERCLAKK